MHASHLARVAAGLVVVTFSLLVSCADSAPADAPDPSLDETTVSPEPTGPSINWDLPYGSEVPTNESLGAAKAEVSYAFETPSFGAPDVVQVAPAELFENDGDRPVAMIFRLPEVGAILLEVRPAGDFTVDVMEQMVAARAGEPADPIPGEEMPSEFTPAYQMVHIRGTDALFVQGRGLGRVTWIEKGVRYDLMGETATAKQVLELADML